METTNNQKFQDTISYKKLSKCEDTGEQIEKDFKVFKNQPTEEEPFIIESYPYGRFRTQMRVWVESVKKKGDRLCKQTLNPKTKKWNKPKKSTYDEIILLGIDVNSGHVKRFITFTHWDDEEKFKHKKNIIKSLNIELNELQKIQIKELNVIYKIRSHIDYEFKPVEYRHKLTGEITTQVPLFEMSDYEKIEETEDKNKAEISLAKLNYMYRKEEGLI